MTLSIFAALLSGAIASGSAPAAPHGDVDRAARDFRLQLYNTFRNDRDGYNHRLAQWSRVESAWSLSGAPATEQTDVLGWLTVATERSKPGAVSELPEPPSFVIGAEVNRELETWWHDEFPGQQVQAVTAEAAKLANQVAKEKSAKQQQKPGLGLPFDLSAVMKPEDKPAAESSTVSAGSADAAPQNDVLQSLGRQVEQGFEKLQSQSSDK